MSLPDVIFEGERPPAAARRRAVAGEVDDVRIVLGQQRFELPERAALGEAEYHLLVKCRGGPQD